jgi:Tol biopolymer transport system component
VSDASGNNDIYLQAVGGQNPINLTEDSPSDDTTPAFSPDGERIAFRSEREGGGIFIMGRTGESPRLVVEKGFAPAWSPDGEEIAFSTRPLEGRCMTAAPGGELWAVKVASREKRRLFSRDGTQPRWSPHGHRVVFVTTTERVFRDIRTVAAGGAGEAVPVTSGAGVEWSPVWSADGTHLYFVSSRGGSPNLWRISLDERSGKVLGEPEPLTAASTDVDDLTVSADGKRIAYVSREGRTENIMKVAFEPERARVEGEPTWLTSGSNQIFPFDVSPDSNWVAYQRTNTTPLAILRADGTGKRDIGDFSMILPSWSGDGSWIAFNATPPGSSGHRNIYRSRRDGTGLEQLTDSQGDGVPAYFHSVYSPDGTRIAMHTARGKKGNAFLLDVRAGLARPPQPFPPLTVGGEYFDPHSWSPNGEWLAGQAIDSNLMGIHHGIVLYSLKDKTYDRLTDFGSSATWLPDNRRLVFDWKGELYLLDRVTKATRPVYSVRPPEKLRWARLCADGRQLFFLRSIDEADIWMAELK